MLQTLPVVGPVAPANLHLSLWLMIVLGVGLTGLAAVVGNRAGART